MLDKAIICAILNTNKHINGIKKMNEQFKQNILNAIRNNTIVNTSHWGAASYIVYNAQGVKLIEAVCDFDYGAYMLTVGDTVVLSANKNTTHRDTPAEPVVREVGDICRACAEQFEIQEKLKFVKRQMSAQEKNLSAFLAQASSKTK